jgi:hypothetical protein
LILQSLFAGLVKLLFMLLRLVEPPQLFPRSVFLSPVFLQAHRAPFIPEIVPDTSIGQSLTRMIYLSILILGLSASHTDPT